MVHHISSKQYSIYLHKEDREKQGSPFPSKLDCQLTPSFASSASRNRLPPDRCFWHQVFWLLQKSCICLSFCLWCPAWSQASSSSLMTHQRYKKDKHWQTIVFRDNDTKNPLTLSRWCRCLFLQVFLFEGMASTFDSWKSSPIFHKCLETWKIACRVSSSTLLVRWQVWSQQNQVPVPRCNNYH